MPPLHLEANLLGGPSLGGCGGLDPPAAVRAPPRLGCGHPGAGAQGSARRERTPTPAPPRPERPALRRPRPAPAPPGELGLRPPDARRGAGTLGCQPSRWSSRASAASRAGWGWGGAPGIRHRRSPRPGPPRGGPDRPYLQHPGARGAQVGRAGGRRGSSLAPRPGRRLSMPSAARGRLPPAGLWPRRARARGGGPEPEAGPGEGCLCGPPAQLPQTSESLGSRTQPLRP